jgi:hypothetical protein
VSRFAAIPYKGYYGLTQWPEVGVGRALDANGNVSRRWEAKIMLSSPAIEDRLEELELLSETYTTRRELLDLLEGALWGLPSILPAATEPLQLMGPEQYGTLDGRFVVRRSKSRPVTVQRNGSVTFTRRQRTWAVQDTAPAGLAYSKGRFVTVNSLRAAQWRIARARAWVPGTPE